MLLMLSPVNDLSPNPRHRFQDRLDFSITLIGTDLSESLVCDLHHLHSITLVIEFSLEENVLTTYL